jgi:hypothetical protein
MGIVSHTEMRFLVQEEKCQPHSEEKETRRDEEQTCQQVAEDAVKRSQRARASRDLFKAGR